MLLTSTSVSKALYPKGTEDYKCCSFEKPILNIRFIKVFKGGAELFLTHILSAYTCSLFFPSAWSWGQVSDSLASCTWSFPLILSFSDPVMYLIRFVELHNFHIQLNSLPMKVHVCIFLPNFWTLRRIKKMCSGNEGDVDECLLTSSRCEMKRSFSWELWTFIP